MDLFAEEPRKPLAARMRPTTLKEFVGQDEILAPGTFLRRMIDADNLPSILLYGPPGTGKTTLASVVAHTSGAHFEVINAVSSGIADIRKAVEAARQRLLAYHRRTVLFIDEIHRFNKGQQDALLPYVEDGTVTLIGATTENPYFEVNAPLLSRMRVVRLQPLSDEDIKKILLRAMQDRERGLGDQDLQYDELCLNAIAQVAGGDARTALNVLEHAAELLSETGEHRLTLDAIAKASGEKVQRYDKNGDRHYDTISAFIKSMRGSDPDAAIHYLARMLEAGEDIKFIARRIMICASEDVGNADPQALVVAMAAAQAVQFVGMPEARIPLAQAVVYVATAPKSNASYLAIDRALADVRQRSCGSVPAHLRDAHYRGAAKFGHGLDYQYPHDFKNAYVVQQYLPDPLVGTVYYQPSGRGYEEKIQERQASRKKFERQD